MSIILFFLNRFSDFLRAVSLISQLHCAFNDDVLGNAELSCINDCDTVFVFFCRKTGALIAA